MYNYKEIKNRTKCEHNEWEEREYYFYWFYYSCFVVVVVVRL